MPILLAFVGLAVIRDDPRHTAADQQHCQHHADDAEHRLTGGERRQTEEERHDADTGRDQTGRVDAGFHGLTRVLTGGAGMVDRVSRIVRHDSSFHGQSYL